MKALTLTQPWATLIVLGEKTLETRSWRPPAAMIGQRIAIHAGKNLAPVGGRRGLEALCWSSPVRGALYPIHPDGAITVRFLPLGMVVATARLGQVLRTEDVRFDWRPRFEEAFGDYSPGRYAWELEDVRPVRPVEARGAQQLWELPRELELEELPR